MKNTLLQNCIGIAFIAAMWKFGGGFVWVAVFATIFVSGLIAIAKHSQSGILRLMAASVLVTALLIGSIVGYGYTVYRFPGFVVAVKNFGRKPGPSTLLWTSDDIPSWLAASIFPGMLPIQGTVAGGPGFNVRFLAYSLNVVQTAAHYTVCTVTGTGDMTIITIAAIPTLTVSTGSSPTIAIQDTNATVNTWLTATATTAMTAGRAITMTNPALRQTTLNGNKLEFVVATATITTGAITLVFGAAFTATGGTVPGSATSATVTANCT